MSDEKLPAEIVDVLHPRVVEASLERLRADFFTDAAHRAMVEVELALKEGECGNMEGR